MFLEGVEADRVREATIVVFLTEGSLGVLADGDEVLEVELVGEVHVEVVLDVLDLVNPLLNKSVSPDSWEGEGFVVELPGVYSDMGVEALVSLHFTVDDHSGVVMLDIEVSGEQIDFLIELSLGDIDCGLTRSGKFLLND